MHKESDANPYICISMKQLNISSFFNLEQREFETFSSNLFLAYPDRFSGYCT